MVCKSYKNIQIEMATNTKSSNFKINFLITVFLFTLPYTISSD